MNATIKRDPGVVDEHGVIRRLLLLPLLATLGVVGYVAADVVSGDDLPAPAVAPIVPPTPDPHALCNKQLKSITNYYAYTEQQRSEYRALALRHPMCDGHPLAR